MATVYIYSGATGAANGTSWTDAYTTISAALTGGLTASDTGLLASDHSETGTTALTLNFPTTPGLRLVSVNRTSGLAEVGAVIARGAGSVAITINNSVYGYGIDFQGATNNSASAYIQHHNSTSNGCHQSWESCTFNTRTASASANYQTGLSSSLSDDLFFEYINCTWRWNATGQTWTHHCGRVEIYGMALAGTVSPTTLFTANGTGGMVEVSASDLTGLSWSTLVSGSLNPFTYEFTGCKLNSGITALSSSASTNGGTQVWLSDCASGDTHLDYGYYNALGSVTRSTATYLTAGVAGVSWLISTTAAVTRANPFKTPWIDRYYDLTSAVTPYFEVLRNNGTAAAYTDAEVFGEFEAKVTSASTAATFYSDRASPESSGSAQAAGVGTGSWTITGSFSPYSFKVDTGASLTPAETGYLRGRLCVGVASVGALHLAPSVLT